MWLSTWRLPADVQLFEARLADSRPTWGEAHASYLSQRAMACEPIGRWATLSVGDIARAALGNVAGRSFFTTAEYRKWRAATGAIEDTIPYWGQRLPIGATEPDCAPQVAEAARRDPRLLLALATMRRHNHPKDPSRTCPTPAVVVAVVAANSGKKSPLWRRHTPSTPQP